MDNTSEAMQHLHRFFGTIGLRVFTPEGIREELDDSGFPDVAAEDCMVASGLIESDVKTIAGETRTWWLQGGDQWHLKEGTWYVRGSWGPPCIAESTIW